MVRTNPPPTPQPTPQPTPRPTPRPSPKPTSNSKIDKLNQQINLGLDQGPVIGFHYRTDNDAFYHAVAELTAMLVHDERTQSKEVNYILKNGTKYRKQDGALYVILRAVNIEGFRVCVGVATDPSHKYVIGACPDDYLATPEPLR